MALLAAALAGAAGPARPSPAAAPDPSANPAPLPPPGEMARCKALIDAGATAAARERLAPIVALHPEWARALGLLGLTYYRENRFEPARELFERALAADPEEVAVRPLHGWTLYSLGELDAAAEAFEALAGRMPEYAPARYALGVIELDRDRLDAARGHLEAAIRLAREQADPPMEGRARARLGDLYARRGDLAEARAELERAVELHPGEHEALYKLWRVLQRLGEDEAAEAARERYEAARAADEPGMAALDGIATPGGTDR